MRFQNAVLPVIGCLMVIGPAHASTTIDCLQSHVLVSNSEVKDGIAGRVLSFSVTNNLTHAIAGIDFRFVITSAGREVPWINKDSAMQIAGGVEPGETRTFGQYLVQLSSDAPDDLDANLTLVNAIDASLRPIVKTDTIYAGWSDEPSDVGCP